MSLPKVLVCGSRDWTDSMRIMDALRMVHQLRGPFKVLHGGAKGADRIAGFCARRLGLEVEEYSANWTTHGRRAGYLRNVEMAEQDPDLVSRSNATAPPALR